MKTAATLVACAAFALAAVSANAQDKKDASKDKPMTAQECKDYMAMAAKDAKMKDAKKDTMCNDMMKKDGGAMKSDATKKQ
jgi:uncharacterized protein YutE (UPF0331/DUF86 family)